MQSLTPDKPKQDKHLSQSALVPDILGIIKNEGGVESKKIVEKLIYQMHKDEFVKPWYNQLVSRGIPGKMNNWLKENTHTISVKYHPFWNKDVKMIEVEMFNKSHLSFDDWKKEIFE